MKNDLQKYLLSNAMLFHISSIYYKRSRKFWNVERKREKLLKIYVYIIFNKKKYWVKYN